MPVSLVPDAVSDAPVRDGGLRADGSARWGELMAQAQAGDRAAYHALLSDVSPYLRAIARKYLRQEQDAEDMVQEILIVVHDIRHTYEPGRPFKPWLGTIATRRCIDALRQRTRRLAGEGEGGADAGALLDGIADDGARPDEALDQWQDRRRVHGALAALPPRQREAVRLLRIEQLSLEEAAAHSAQSVGSLKVACHRALKALREVLGDARSARGAGDAP